MNVAAPVRARTLGQVHVPTVMLAHGGGGKAMKDLIDDVFVSAQRMTRLSTDPSGSSDSVRNARPPPSDTYD